MGNCIALSANETSLTKERDPLPIETIFELPSLLPSWPSGKGFASGSMNLGGLEVHQVTAFTKVWATHEGGQDNLGATFFKPSQIPEGFYMLGYYSQPNNKPLFGSVLVAKGESDGDIEGGMLRKPVDFTLVWSNESLNQDGNGYIWAPTPPQGYVAVGHMVTNSPRNLPSMKSDVFVLILPRHVRVTCGKTQAVRTGTFLAQVNGATSPSACLKNLDASLSSMPTVRQIEQLMGLYSPFIYFHPDEPYLPSSVAWFFNSGALLYKKGDPNPTPIDQTGSNLPQGGWSDGTYWLDLPRDNDAKEALKKGDLNTSKCYVHVKPMFGESFTDIAIWVFYPFNGPGKAKVIFVDLPLGRIGEHVGDWEHVTLRISNLDGKLKRVYFSEHSSGIWVEASELEYQGGTKPVVYASLHGHAFFPKPGLVLQGNDKLGIGLRNDAGKGAGIDTGSNYILVAAEYLGSGRWGVVEPPWLSYAREWGPKIDYNIEQELDKASLVLPGYLKPVFKHVFQALPKEVLGEEGPTGPKMKNSWNGDE
ncbi:Vacuolar protein sorting-associated protein 62 [Cinnamomum micranthum f. kanehirae]|uniref:Vacuolar protein sorting-associated protein 62 n=1 Tax=Cinnamomum micranthum f. kanehirae TaxID=337451 RepID=A0A443N5C7_9MAGN|nr:Vacuolar protein sorting-associated protein 62 [Cinnamomum micranthum f. kanehirae]